MRSTALGLRRLTVLFGGIAALAMGTAAQANVAPSISGTPATTGAAGQLYSFQPTASDPDGDVLNFGVSGLPRWASFDRKTGRLYGRPGSRDVGTTKPITISVTDTATSLKSLGGTVSSLPSFQITVGAGGAPTISGSPQSSVVEGAAYNFVPVANDPEGAKLTFSIANKPAWATFSRSTGLLAGTPGTGTAGTYSGIRISVTDGATVTSLPSFAILVSASARANIPPELIGTAPGTVEVGKAYFFAPTASDPDSQTLTFSIANKPAWTSFDPASGKLSGTPTLADVGTYSGIVISVSDGLSTTSLSGISIAVKEPAVMGSATLAWQPPQQNVDGTPVTNLAGYRIRYGQSSGSLDQVLDIPSAAITAATIESLTSGTWYFAVKAYTAASVESDLSNVVQKLIN